MYEYTIHIIIIHNKRTLVIKISVFDEKPNAMGPETFFDLNKFLGFHVARPNKTVPSNRQVLSWVRLRQVSHVRYITYYYSSSAFNFSGHDRV